MCFSATASFTSALILIPVGVYCLNKSRKIKKSYWVFAVMPLLFGIQQALEGLVWLEIEPYGSGNVRAAALGFMFFSHLFWIFWVPFSCYMVETDGFRKKLFYLLMFLGAIHGLLIYVPLLVNDDWLSVGLVGNSIDYTALMLHDNYVPVNIMRLMYGVFVLLPLLICSDYKIKLFGISILVSAVISGLYFSYTFISIWCYFAAILSLYLCHIIIERSRESKI